VHLWMIDQHLGRRSVSDFQRGVLALRKKDILLSRQQARLAGADATTDPATAHTTPEAHSPADTAAASPEAAAIKPAEPLNSREAIAKAARISSTTVSQIEKIQKAAAPELVAAVKAGDISINAAAAVASLPVEEQVASVAGGKKALQQAARQVREAKAQARATAVGEMLDQPAGDTTAPEGADPATQALIQRLNDTIATLTAENARLKAELAAYSATIAST
jgi:hypothetical protein